MIRNNRRRPAICDETGTGKLVVITGATSGIGYDTARYYASKGANLLCINRNQQKSERLKQKIEGEFGVHCDYRIADLSRIPDSFRVAGELVQLETNIDVLIHNAGVYMTEREVTPDGFEQVFAVHYLSTFIINYLLMDKLKAQQEARIIMVGSEGHRFAAWGLEQNDYDSIVVGAGAAGLTAAVFLARAGQKVLLIEKNRELGGLVNTFVRNGFHFDAGVRALEDAGIILPMLQDLNLRIESVRSPVSLGVEDEILNIESIESLKDYSALLKKFYPENAAEIDEVIKTIRKIMKYMDVLYGIENPVFKDLKRDTGFIFKKLLPWMPRFMMTVGKINKMQLPVEEYLNTVVSNPSLRDIISQHFFRNTPTFFAMSYFSLYLDYFYPKGGVGRLSETLGAKIRELGGVIKNRTTVQRVIPGDKLLFDDKGVQYSYTNLVWAGDLKTLYRISEADYLAPEEAEQINGVKSKVLRNKGGESVFTLYLQVDEPVETFGKIANGHFFYTPSRQGLGETHRREFEELMSRLGTIGNSPDAAESMKQELLEWLSRFVALNTFEISIPALRDKSLAPEGKTGMIISFLAEHALFKKVQEAGWLGELITATEEQIIAVLSRSVFPMLEGKILHRFSFSPLSIENRTGSSEGAIVGWEFNVDMPVINDIRIADRSVFTPFPSVYQAGQWAYSPAGVPMSILTGKLAADAILKRKK